MCEWRFAGGIANDFQWLGVSRVARFEIFADIMQRDRTRKTILKYSRCEHVSHNTIVCVCVLHYWLGFCLLKKGFQRKLEKVRPENYVFAYSFTSYP